MISKSPFQHVLAGNDLTFREKLKLSCRIDITELWLYNFELKEHKQRSTSSSAV